MKYTISEKQIRRIVKESLENNNSFDYEQKIRSLSNNYNNYWVNDTSKLALEKVWNRGQGRQHLIEIVPEENVILYNKHLMNKKDYEIIKAVFPGLKWEAVELSMYGTQNLRFCRGKHNTMNENHARIDQIIKEVINEELNVNNIKPNIDEKEIIARKLQIKYQFLDNFIRTADEHTPEDELRLARRGFLFLRQNQGMDPLDLKRGLEKMHISLDAKTMKPEDNQIESISAEDFFENV